MRYIGSTTKPLCWVLAFALLCMWSGLPEYLVYAQDTPQSLTSDEAAKFRSSLEQIRSKIDFSELDPTVLQGRIGDSSKSLMRFIQEKIGFEPYTGVLRGARGTLLARAGNAADRALLLAHLLRQAGHQVRFAKGQLSYDQAEKLLRSSFSLPVATDKLPPLINDLLANAENHFLLLGNALFEAGFEPPSTAAQAWRQAIIDTQQHTWVQIAESGQWIDIDPSPDMQFGQALVTAEQISEELDEALFHQIELSLEIEVERAEERQHEQILELKATAAELAGIPLGLSHAIAGERVTAHFIVGDRVVESRPFVIPQRATRRAKGIGDLFGGIQDALNRLPSGPFDLEKTDQYAFLAERLHVRTTGPIASRQATHVIVDTNGSGSVLVRDALEAVYGISVITGTIAETLPAAVLSDVKDPFSAVGVSKMLAAFNLTYMFLRQQMPTSFFEPTFKPYFHSPNILIAKVQGVGPQREIQLAIDLALKSYRIVPMKETEHRDALLFYNYLMNGVIDYTVERAILDDFESGHGVGALFETASNQNIGARAVIEPTTKDFKLSLTPEGKRRIENSLREGNIVVVPDQRPTGWELRTLGWWEVNPSTGWTQDTTEEGYHSQSTEQLIIINQMLRTAPAVKRFGCIVALAMTTAGSVVAQIGEGLTAIGDPTGAVLITIGEAGGGLGEMACGGKIPIKRKLILKPRFPRPQSWKLPESPWIKKIGPFGGGRFGKWR
jgi:Transglutaminase-like superfamily